MSAMASHQASRPAICRVPPRRPQIPRAGASESWACAGLGPAPRPDASGFPSPISAVRTGGSAPAPWSGLSTARFRGSASAPPRLIRSTALSRIRRGPVMPVVTINDTTVAPITISAIQAPKMRPLARRAQAGQRQGQPPYRPRFAASSLADRRQPPAESPFPAALGFGQSAESNAPIVTTPLARSDFKVAVLAQGTIKPRNLAAVAPRPWAGSPPARSNWARP